MEFPLNPALIFGEAQQYVRAMASEIRSAAKVTFKLIQVCLLTLISAPSSAVKCREREADQRLLNDCRVIRNVWHVRKCSLKSRNVSLVVFFIIHFPDLKGIIIEIIEKKLQGPTLFPQDGTKTI